MSREYRVLLALVGQGVPAPLPLALCTDSTITGAPFLVMECVDGVSLVGELPPSWPTGEGMVAALGESAIDALVALHSVDWRKAGLEGFGRPEGFLDRQVDRWRAQQERHAVRELPLMEPIGTWLSLHMPPEIPAAIMRGNFHIDNCLAVHDPLPGIAAIIDWELASIGDPLLDLGLCSRSGCQTAAHRWPCLRSSASPAPTRRVASSWRNAMPRAAVAR